MPTQRTIREALQEANPQLLQRSESLIQQSIIIATHAPSSFPRATSHGPDHTSTVEAIGDMVLSETFASLSPHELFFLRLAYYYHDLGMVGEEVEFATVEGREQIRRQHAISVGEKIMRKWNELGFQNENEARILALICRGHRPKRNDEGIASWDELDRVAPIGPNASVRLRLVSAMIYAIDELHIGDDRAQARLKKWIDLKDDESRRHWKRHDAISGPTKAGEELLFNAVVKTTIQEKDLRRNVFAKAFRATRDLRCQLKVHDVEGTTPELVVQWNRETLYRLLVFKAAASGKEKVVLIEEVTAIFNDAFLEFENLSQLCKERGNENVIEEVGAAVEQLEVISILVHADETSGTLQLSTNEKETGDIVSMLQEADQIDLLFGGLFDGNHEFDLHCTSFGDRFVADQVQPIIERHYGVRLDGDPIAAEIEVLLKASPSAARFSRDLKPIPTDVVKQRLLAMAATTGFMRDCLQNPNLILDARARSSFRAVSRFCTTEFDKVVEFVEELALIGGFDYGQLIQIVGSSNTDAADPPPSDEEPFRFHFSQTVAKDAPPEATLFPYLLLAGTRSGTAVQFRCNYDSSISTTSSGKTPDNWEGMSEISPCRIQIGPAVGQMLPCVDLRADVEVDRSINMLRLIVQEPSHRANTMPIIIGMPAPVPDGRPVTTPFTLYLPNVTVGNLSDLYYLAAAAGAGKKVSIKLASESGTAIADSTPKNDEPFSFDVGLSRDLVDRLSSVDRTIPAPFFLGAHLIERLEKSSELSETIEEIRTELSEERPIESFALVLQNESAQTYREEFLTVRPGFTFKPPSIGEEIEFTQEQLDGMWSERTRLFAIGSSFREDPGALAKSFREWSADPKKPWPVTTGETNERFHQIKTAYFFIRGQIVDRFWYREAPNYIILRSATKRERLQTELEYWKDIGDDNRALLLEEKLARMDSEKSNEIPFQSAIPAVAVENNSGPKSKKKESKTSAKKDRKKRRKAAEKQNKRNRKK